MTYLYEALDKPTRLYIKQCPHCGLKYFGKSATKNISSYPGSGKIWKQHLRKYNVIPTHLWNSGWYYDTSISRFAIKFSVINNIVGSKNWLNLKLENGLDGGKTWDASTNISHPFVNGNLQKELVEKGSHHFLGKVTCVDEEGNFLSVNQIEYQTNESLVNPMSKEGFKRLGKKESDRYIHNVSNVDFSNKRNSLKGDERTKAQKVAAKKHSEYQKKNAVTPTPKGGKLSESHKNALSIPRPWAGLHGNQVKGDKHFAKNKIICPHCKKIGGGGSMKRWHFDNCKKKR